MYTKKHPGVVGGCEGLSKKRLDSERTDTMSLLEMWNVSWIESMHIPNFFHEEFTTLQRSNTFLQFE